MIRADQAGARSTFAVVLLALLTLAMFAACDSSVRVGELAPPSPPAAPLPGTLASPPDAGPLPAPTWRQESPAVPCSIFAVEEVRADDLFVGCAGGRIYRYDGVRARLTFSAPDELGIVSLLWAAPDGQVWAGLQSSAKPSATTTLLRFDGVTWLTVAGPSQRVVSIAGTDSTHLWIATESEIFRRVGERFVSVYKAAPGAGAFRACTFASPTTGYCVGTSGLVVAWDGTQFAPLATDAWSHDAEVFGVEFTSMNHVPYFLFGEPITSAHGDHACRIARLVSGVLTPLTASIPCFADFEVARKRTGTVDVGFRAFMLISPESDYGGAFAFDVAADTVHALCGPAVAFTSGVANTRVGGAYGFLATLVGSGSDQLTLTGANGSNIEFKDLSVSPGGVAWARTVDTTVCGSSSGQIVRRSPVEGGGFLPVPSPQGALSGSALAAVSEDHVYTIDGINQALLEYVDGTWKPGPALDNMWSLSASRANNVWVGTARDGFAHFDGKALSPLRSMGHSRQIEHILGVDSDVWMVARGFVQNDTDEHVIRVSNGQIDEWNVGVDDVRLAAAPLNDGSGAQRVWRTGRTDAAVWDGKKWTPLGFPAEHVWARAANEVYFASYGNISRWDGKTLTTVFHGLTPISEIDGSQERGFAVGPGGLVIEFAHFPPPTK